GRVHDLADLQRGTAVGVLHALEPIDLPFHLVEYVGDAIARLRYPEVVAEGTRILLKRGQQLVYRLRGVGDVLVGVAGVEPAAREVAGLGWVAAVGNIARLNVLPLSKVSRVIGPAGECIRRFLREPAALIEVHAHRGT